MGHTSMLMLHQSDDQENYLNGKFLGIRNTRDYGRPVRKEEEKLWGTLWRVKILE